MIKQVIQKSFSKLLHNNNIAIKGFSSAILNLPEDSYDTHLLENFQDKIPKQAEISKEDCLQYYEQMQVMRRMEIACDNLYKNQEIRGFCHLYDGQEAVIRGIEAALTWEDPMITAYRDHCHAYMRGDTPEQIIAEQLGKITGSTKGKGGSMHYYRKKSNWYGGNGIVGAQVPIGAGLAFALKYSKKQNVCVSMYGDGAANQGQLYEAANMAGLWKLPVIFICENNNYAMGTSISRHANFPYFYKRDPAIPGIKLNGSDVFAVREGLKFCKQYAIENGPIFVEATTYRYHGHSMSDPGISYRSRDEVQNYRKQHDCIDYVKQVILDHSFSTEKEIKAIDKKVREEIDQAIQNARAARLPDETELTTAVYVDNENNYIRGVEITHDHNKK